jgi:cation diffusion facilitator family transporter
LLQGLKIASRPPDEAHPYGHHRAESITSKLLAIILAITAIGIGNEAINILRSGEIIPPKPIAVYIALISVIIKEMMYQYTVRIGRKVRSSAVIADAWNHRSDALSSIATVIGITGAIWGFAFMDPVAGIVVSILILRTAVYIYIEAIHSLMDKAPAREVLDSIRSAAKEARGVKAVQEVKVRQYGSKYVVDMKICVDPNITVEEGHGAAARAKENILNVNRDVLDVLIHVNPCFSDPIKEACKECSENQNSPS